MVCGGGGTVCNKFAYVCNTILVYLTKLRAAGCAAGRTAGEAFPILYKNPSRIVGNGKRVAYCHSNSRWWSSTPAHKSTSPLSAYTTCATHKPWPKCNTEGE